MPTLLIQTKTGEIYQSKASLHFMVAEKFDIDPEDIVRVGFITKGREIWEERSPH